MDDLALLTQYVSARSESAFAALVERHKDWIYSTCLRRLGNAHLAEDAAQAVFIALAQKAPFLLNHPSLTSWLYRVAQFTALDARKREHRRSLRQAEAAHMNIAAAPDAPSELWLNIAPRLETALDRLPERYRLPLLLRFYQKQTAAQIASALHISEAAAQKRILRALDRLRAKLLLPPAAASSLALLLPANLLTTAPLSISASTALSTNASTSFALSQGALHMMVLAKLKTLAATLACILLILAGAASLSLILLHHQAAARAASSEPAAPMTAAEQRAAFIAPYLHDNTLLIMHADIYRIDLKASANAFKSNPTLAAAQINQQSYHAILTAADDFLTRFKQAGGRHFYVLVPQPFPTSASGPIMLFPLEAGAQGTDKEDPQLLAKVIGSLPGLPPVTQLNDHLLVCCDPADLALLKSPASPRPELQKAFLETSGGIQVAIAPTDVTRALLTRNPKAAQLHTLISSLQYITLSVDLPTSGEIVVIGQCDTDDHAAASAQEWNTFLTQILAASSKHLSAQDLATFKNLSLVTPNGKSITLTLHDNLETASAFLALTVALPKMNAPVTQPASTQEK